MHNNKLPKMKEDDDLKLFVTLFEAALISAEVPRRDWKRCLHSQLTLNAKHKILHLLQNADSTYDELKEALMGCAAMTFGTATEAFFTGDRGKIAQLTPRQAAEKMRRWIGKVTQETDENEEALDYVTVAALRAWMVPDLKKYVDTSKINEMQSFLRIIEEWERSQTEGTPPFKKATLTSPNMTTRPGQSSQTGYKKNISCFFCGKLGHVSCDCRSRLASDKQATPAPSHGATLGVPPATPRTERKPIVCFNCHQAGHKSPQCPKSCKSCTICQKRDRQTVAQANKMQPREIVTVPSELVAIDIVGPFPVAKGGFTYLLTYLDMATR